MKIIQRVLACILVCLSIVLVGCGKSETSTPESEISNEEGSGGEAVIIPNPLLGEWKLVDLVEVVNGNEHIIAKTLSSKKTGSADYFALSSWFVIKVFDEGVLECSSSSAIVKPYIEEYGSAGSWEALDDGSYKIYADGLLNSGIVPKPKDGYMTGVVDGKTLTCSGESEDGVLFIATLRYAGAI